MATFTIQAPDGRKIKIQAADEATALRGAKEWASANPAEKAQPKQAQPKPAAGPMDFLAQGLSGLNEGIAMGLGAPVELASAGINLATTGINKVAGTNIPQIDKPVGGFETFRGILAPTIREESADPALNATRRIAQEVGAFAIPGGATISKAAKPLATAGKELAAALGSGTGAAIAQQIAPDNPLAEFAGQIAGSLTPAGAARLASKPQRVPIDELRTARDSAYKAAEKAGASFSPSDYDNMLTNLVQDVKSANISPTRHQQAYSFITDMIGRRNGKPMTLTELDQLRQEVRRDLVTPSYGNPDKAADAFYGDKIVDAIDDMIATNTVASPLMKTARAAHSRLRKTELIEEAIIKAERRAGSTGSGGNLNNAIRQNIRGILDSKKKSKGFTKEELAEMESLVKQGKMENLLRLVGKLSPSGNGLSSWIGIGAASQGYGAIPIAGMVAKTLADRGTVRKAAELQNRVAGGGKKRAGLPMATPAVTYAQAANQLAEDGPVEITVRGGAR